MNKIPKNNVKIPKKSQIDRQELNIKSFGSKLIRQGYKQLKLWDNFFKNKYDEKQDANNKIFKQIYKVLKKDTSTIPGLKIKDIYFAQKFKKEREDNLKEQKQTRENIKRLGDRFPQLKDKYFKLANTIMHDIMICKLYWCSKLKNYLMEQNIVLEQINTQNNKIVLNKISKLKKSNLKAIKTLQFTIDEITTTNEQYKNKKINGIKKQKEEFDKQFKELQILKPKLSKPKQIFIPKQKKIFKKIEIKKIIPGPKRRKVKGQKKPPKKQVLRKSIKRPNGGIKCGKFRNGKLIWGFQLKNKIIDP
ncbi:hypothetical protein ACFL2K_04290, partial [Candidatus Margulisiibacteriota bacterium]